MVNLEILAALAFTLSILTPAVITKVYFGSFSKGLMLFVLNFALSFTRMKAAIAAVLHNSPMRGWIKGDGLEVGSEDLLVVQELRRGAVLLRHTLRRRSRGGGRQQPFGGLWLFWYAALYSSTFFFFFKYG